MNSTAPQRSEIERLLDQTNYRRRFEEMLGARAPQYISSIITVYKGFSQPVEPSSVIAAAAIAATLDLPIEKNLGFAHIVPYGNVAQFQMGYKGFIQLALRSGQYKSLNAQPINKEALKGYDEIGDPIIDWAKLDTTQEPIGYAFAWKLVSGFTKTIYWSKEKIRAHAERYSQAYRKKKTDSPWFTSFDQMSLKTVIKDGLNHWGILSVQLQKAMVFDQTTMKDLDAEPVAIDNPRILPASSPDLGDSASSMGKAEADRGDEASEAAAGLAPVVARASSPVSPSGVPPVKPRRARKPTQTADQEEAQLDPAPPPTPARRLPPPPPPPPPPEPEPIKPIDIKSGETHVIMLQLARGIVDADIQEEDLMNFCKREGMASAAQYQLGQLATKKLITLCERWPDVIEDIRKHANPIQS